MFLFSFGDKILGVCKFVGIGDKEEKTSSEVESITGDMAKNGRGLFPSKDNEVSNGVKLESLEPTLVKFVNELFTNCHSSFSTLVLLRYDEKFCSRTFTPS